MNNYLTTKSAIKSKISIAILVFCGLMVVAGICIIPQQFKVSTKDGLMNLVLIVAFSLPIVFIVLSFMKMNTAKKYAYIFSNNTDTTITFKELSKRIHKDNVDLELQKLVSKGYLKNIIVDLETDTVLLTAENANKAKKIYIKVKCKSCGNNATIVKGEKTKCPFCHRILMG